MNIQIKAREIAKTIGHPDFRASYGWLQRFSKRTGLNICGEGTQSKTQNEQKELRYTFSSEWGKSLFETGKQTEDTDCTNQPSTSNVCIQKSPNDSLT